MPAIALAQPTFAGTSDAVADGPHPLRNRGRAGGARLRVSAWILGVFCALPVLSAVGSQVWRVNLVGDMDEPGRKLIVPTREQPAFYYPIVQGYTEMGAKLVGEQPPAPREIVHQLAATLAGQNYFVSNEIEVPVKGNPSAKTKALQPKPSLILVFHWGSLRPEKLDLGTDFTSNAPAAVTNQNQMIGLIAGKKFDSIVDFGVKTQEIWDGVQDDRFFVMVSAYDFDAYFQQHKKIRLWVAKMSMPASGVTMTEVMPTLIKQGGAIFGRETTGPKVLDVPSAPEGQVDVGIPTVVEEKK